ncbi:ABC transporter substrate-binding protein [Vibrio sp. CyArs1]|uniref:heme/hemin ABC transporter substrate-binding protein n=1 Tax=Vibrio sp. CyArs1 TaxID=2682577 RepID=UPI001F059DE6|nr:ABC transporter substrate-binding protein [Vibrio sp. CyArs1]
MTTASSQVQTHTKNLSLVFAMLTLFISPFSLAQNRIISAGYGVTEIIYALEAQEQLVAADYTSRSFIEGANISQVGIHVRLSAEGLLAQEPTQLIGTNEMGPPSVIDKVKQSGVNVNIVSSEQSVKGLIDRIHQIGSITQNEEKANLLATAVEQDVQTMNDSICQQKPNVVFFMLDRSSNIRVGGKNTAIDSVISLSGASNPASDLIQGYKAMNAEAMFALQPDYILVSQRAWDMYGSKEKILNALPLLKSTNADNEGNIVVISSGALLGGFGLSSIKLAKKLHQTYCQ